MVKKGSKIRSRTSGAIPQPVSATSWTAKRPGSRFWPGKAVSIAEASRCSVRVARVMVPSWSPMASEALGTRFMITCWIWAMSASMCGRSGLRENRSSTFFGSVAFSSWAMSSATRLRSRVWTTKVPRPE